MRKLSAPAGSNCMYKILLAGVALAAVTGSGSAFAQCQRRSGTVGYYLAKNYFGVAGCDGVKARDKEIREVCRVLLGATSRAAVTYNGLLTGSFHSPNDNSHCYFVNGTDASNAKTISNAGAIGNPPNLVSVNCACVVTQCNDGRDNDGDGAIDLRDFSCGNNPLSSTEATPQSQCQDGADNDSDGAADLNDFSCGGDKQKNDEANPKAQCQDGSDNDRDGSSDLADFSCGGNKQKNDETAPKAQCQDGIDNDGDGAMDLADFSCGMNAQKNDEATPKSQCQDGIDNDGDGAVDLADFSCGGNRQKNDEASPKPQCDDGRDNDGNSLVDLNDPGCSGKQDNEETGGQSAITSAVECVFNNANGTKTAYFSFVNTGQAVSTGFSSSFSTGAVATEAPSALKAGACRGCAHATFSGDAVTWTLEGATIGRVVATANGDTPRCGNVLPVFSCKGFANGKLRIKAGWNNPNDFTVRYPVGNLNKFAPGAADVGQPVEFLSGLVPAAFEVDAGDGKTPITWTLNGRDVASNNDVPTCSGECVETATAQIKSSLDETARKLATLTKKAAKALEAAAPDEAVDAKRAAQAADEYVATSKALLLEFPAIIKNCPAAPQTCKTVDRSRTISRLRGLYAQSRNSVKRVASRANFRATGKTNRKDPLIKQALELEKQGNKKLDALPRFATECK